MNDLTAALQRFAAKDTVLIVSDFDGTLAGFDPDPYAVSADPRSLAALEFLSELDGTTVAVLSGRHLEGLAQVCPLGPKILFAGSHGAESSTDTLVLDQAQREHLDYIDSKLDTIASAHPNAFVERKPFQRVLHVAGVAQDDPAIARDLLRQATEINAQGYPVTPGKNVVEFAAADITKGTWLAAQRQRSQAQAVLFIGDDATDETGFAILGPQDIGIKVGAGETAAGFRIDDQAAVADVLCDLARLRSDNSSTSTHDPRG